MLVGDGDCGTAVANMIERNLRHSRSNSNSDDLRLRLRTELGELASEQCRSRLIIESPLSKHRTVDRLRLAGSEGAVGSLKGEPTAGDALVANSDPLCPPRVDVVLG